MMLLSLMPANVDDGDDGHDHVDGDYGTGDVGGCGWQATASVLTVYGLWSATRIPLDYN